VDDDHKQWMMIINSGWWS